MSELETLLPLACRHGILPCAAVTVVSVQWHGSDALTMICRDPSARWLVQEGCAAGRFALLEGDEPGHNCGPTGPKNVEAAGKKKSC